MNESFIAVFQNTSNENAFVCLQFSFAYRKFLKTHPNTFNILSCRTDYFKNFFFLFVSNEWNKLDSDKLDL